MGNKRITVIVTDAEYDFIKKQAGLAPLSRWIVKTVLDAQPFGAYKKALDERRPKVIGDPPCKGVAWDAQLRVHDD